MEINKHESISSIYCSLESRSQTVREYKLSGLRDRFEYPKAERYILLYDQAEDYFWVLILSGYPYCCGLRILHGITKGLNKRMTADDVMRLTDVLKEYMRRVYCGAIQMVDASDAFHSNGGIEDFKRSFRLVDLHPHFIECGWKTIHSFVNPNTGNECLTFVLQD